MRRDKVAPMTSAALKRITIPEFLAFAEAQESDRFELLRGEIVAMAPERAGHARAKFLACRALADAINTAGAGCEAFVDSLGVAVNADTVYIPDALVNCGERLDVDAMLAPAPVIIVEVASPSTRHIDTSIKLTDYFKLPSLSHYLIIDAERRRLVHYRRDAAGAISVSIVTEGALTLDPPGLALEIGAIFD
jgi:Uma2 family endonuclease